MSSGVSETAGAAGSPASGNGATAKVRGYQLLAFIGRQDAYVLQRSSERLRSAAIGVEKLFIEMQRTGEALENFGRAGGEATAPQFHFFAAAAACARTLIGSPIKLMKPSASFWLYSAPMVKLAMLSE